MEIINAKIESTSLGYTHGGFSSNITLDYGDGGHQGFGGWKIEGESCFDWVSGILKALKLNDEGDSWEDVKGTLVRVKREIGHNGKVIAIGHILEDSWFDPRKDLGFK